MILRNKWLMKIINLKIKLKLEIRKNYVLKLKKKKIVYKHTHIILVRTITIVFFYNNCCNFNRKEKVDKALQQIVLD